MFNSLLKRLVYGFFVVWSVVGTLVLLMVFPPFYFEDNNMLDPLGFREDFPIFNASKELVYLDNAATNQKPWQVIKAVEEFYREYNANIHRGLYDLSRKASEKYEEAHGSIMFRLTRYHKPEDIEYVLEQLPEAVERLRRLSPLAKQ